MGFTRRNAQTMRNEIQEALKAIEEKYNAKVNIGNIKYGESLEAKITFSKMSENKNGSFVMTPEAKAFTQKAKGIGLNADVLGEKIIHRGHVYEVTGYSSRRSKYPISFTKDEKPMKCSVDFMKDFVRSGRPEFFI